MSAPGGRGTLWDMKRRAFMPASALLPQVLLRMARDRGDASPLRTVWDEAVGEVSAKHSRPRWLENKTLVVEVESPRWAQALRGEADAILNRLAKSLGEGNVTRLVFEAVEPK